MIKLVKSSSDLYDVIDYIGEQYYKSLYLFLNIKKYGLENPNIKIWMQVDGSISSVILKYHNGMHIFSNSTSFELGSVVDLIKLEHPKIICAEKKIIKLLQSHLKLYKSEYGFVAKFNGFEFSPPKYDIRVASEKDFDSMVKMLLKDDIGKVYSFDDLKNQIKSRISDNYSRSYCIYENNTLVSQVSTGAEESGIATISYVMTDSNYRNRGYAKELVRYMSKQLYGEGFDIYLIYYSENAGKLYLNSGYKNVCEIGKLYL